MSIKSVTRLKELSAGPVDTNASDEKKAQLKIFDSRIDWAKATYKQMRREFPKLDKNSSQLLHLKDEILLLTRKRLQVFKQMR